MGTCVDSKMRLDCIFLYWLLLMRPSNPYPMGPWNYKMTLGIYIFVASSLLQVHNHSWQCLHTQKNLYLGTFYSSFPPTVKYLNFY